MRAIFGTPSFAGYEMISSRTKLCASSKPVAQMINARSETITEKPSFKRLVQQRRCLIPANGFYEWRREGNRKVPIWIHLRDKKPFAFAGLWNLWRDVEGESERSS